MNLIGSKWIKMDQTWIYWIYHYLCRLPFEDEEATANSLEPGLERLLWLKKPESVIAELVLGRLVGLWLLLLLVLLELVKEWVAKSQPSFLKLLYIFPILKPNLWQRWLFFRKCDVFFKSPNIKRKKKSKSLS